MKSIITSSIISMITFGVIVLSGGATSAAEQSGEALFKQHCVVCHPDGGNIINPQKSLHKKSLEARNIKTAGDIIKTMRNPGPGMNKFEARTIPDKQARQIAEYILKTFK